MAQKTDSQLSTLCTTVTNETVVRANNEARIGGLFQDLVDSKLNISKISTDINADTGLNTKVPSVAAVESAISSISGGSIQNVVVDVSSSEITNLMFSKKTLIPSPGPGKLIVPLSIVLYNQFNTTAYSSTAVYIGYTNDDTFQSVSIANVSALFVSASTNYIASYPSSPQGNFTDFVIGSRLVLFASVSAPTSGDGIFKIYISYTTITV